MLLPFLLLIPLAHQVNAHENDDKVTIFTEYDVIYTSFGSVMNIMIDTDRWGPMDVKITDPMGNIIVDEETFVGSQSNQHTFYAVDLVDPFFLRGDYLIEAQMVNHGNEKDDHTVRYDGEYFFTKNEPSLTEYNSTDYVSTQMNVRLPSAKDIYISHVDSDGKVLRDHMWSKCACAGGISFGFNLASKGATPGPIEFSAVDNSTGFVFAKHTYNYVP